MTYKPPQRTVDCKIFTTAGFITAQAHILDRGMVVEQLEIVPEFYKLTQASLVGVETVVDFLALQRDAIVFWIPRGEADDMLQRTLEPGERRRIFVLFGGGVIEGDLEIRSGTRLSDFITKQSGYILLRNCVITMGNVFSEAAPTERADAVIVNVNHVVGISDDQPV